MRDVPGFSSIISDLFSKVTDKLKEYCWQKMGSLAAPKFPWNASQFF